MTVAKLAPQTVAKETIGQRLKRARGNLGLTALQVAERSGLGETTILDYEKDKFPNPGIKTVESLALAVRLDPLELISLGLEESPEMDNGFKASQFGRLWKRYQYLKGERRTFVDELLKMLNDKIDRWR